MNFTLRSSSNPFNQENERLTRKRPAATTGTTLNRFLSFNENKSSSVENRRRLLQSTPNLIELLEEDEDDIDDNQASCHECNTCTRVFASEYGLNHHINMHHPNQSILCSICNITFRSHRSLKTHQQRRHSTAQAKPNAMNSALPNYSYISPYLVLAFSSQQFPIMAKNACEEQRLPLGEFSSKLYQCHLCLISFPCSRTLKYHLLSKHEQYEYSICETILSDLLGEVEFNLRTVDNDEIEIIKSELAQQAGQFGLVNKELSKKLRSTKSEQKHLIYPYCQHEERTCANLCLQYLSSYSKLIKNYPYAITTIPKGNPFAQGSIVSIVPAINNAYASTSSSANETNGSNELTNGRQKRRSIKQTDGSASPRLKRRGATSATITDTKTTARTTLNNRGFVEKQQAEQTSKTNETKFVSGEQPSSAQVTSTSSSAQRKILPKEAYIRSSSMSSNSSTSTRSLMTKFSSSTTNLTAQSSLSSQRASKRSLSPSIALSSTKPSEKRRRARQRKRKVPAASSAAVIRIDDDDIEQENGEDDDNHDVDDVVPIKYESVKERQASSGSIEYVHTLNNDQQLNNIENIKSKSKANDEEIIICRSPPSAKKVIPSSSKAHSKANGARKSNVQQALNNDEHVRVRCKICGEILEGRSRFSKHVISMHSHLLKKNITDPKQQQQTAIVR